MICKSCGNPIEASSDEEYSDIEIYDVSEELSNSDSDYEEETLNNTENSDSDSDSDYE